jgi:hypothetical protein
MYLEGNGPDPDRLSRAVGPRNDFMSESYPGVAGSGDKQAKAKLCCVEIDEVAVAFGPPT